MATSTRYQSTIYHLGKTMNATKKGMLNVLIAAVLWGSSGVCAQYIMEQSQISSSYLTMFRLLFTGVILLTLSFVYGDKIFLITKNRKDTIKLLFFSLVGALTVQLTFLLTIEESNAATATVLQFLSPAIIMVWFSLSHKKRPGIFVLSAIMTSIIGTLLLVTHGDPTSLSISPIALFFGIASAFSAAFYTTYPSELIARYGTLPIVGWSMLIAGLILTPFYSIICGKIFVIDGRLLLAFFYLVVIGTAVTFSLYLKGAQMIGGPKASILSCAEPLISAFLSVICLGVAFTLPDWLGTLLIVSSVVLISIDSKQGIHTSV